MLSGMDPTTATLVRVGCCLIVLLSLVNLLSLYFSTPAFWIDSLHVRFLVGLSNAAMLFSSALILFRLMTQPDKGAIGVSVPAQRITFIAACFRAIFTVYSGVFTGTALWMEGPISAAVSAAVVLRIDPSLARVWGGGGSLTRNPTDDTLRETFPSFSLVLAACGLALFAANFTEHAQSDSLRWVSMAASIYLQAAALLPQRALLLRTKRIPTLTSLAFVLLAIGAAVRLSMWLLLVCEREVHLLLMAGDFVQVGLLADLVVLYMRTVRERGLGAIMGGNMLLTEAV